MKRNAFTLVELLAVIVIFGIVSAIAVGAYSNYIKTSTKKAYEDAESTMEGAAKSLLTFCMTSTVPNDFCQTIPSGGSSIEIDLTTLTDNEFMTLVKDQKKGGVCSGKVKVTNNSSNSDNYNLKYDVCLKCSDYESRSCWY